MDEAEMFRSHCSFCGEITVPPASLRCQLDSAGRDAVCEFSCPICARLILFGTKAPEVLVLRAAGATGMPGRVALEIVEPHSGSPISWDEVLDAHQSLSRTDFPQRELLP